MQQTKTVGTAQHSNSVHALLRQSVKQYCSLTDPVWTVTEDMQLLLLSCWVLTHCFHFAALYTVMTYLYFIFHGQIPQCQSLFTSPSDPQWLKAMHSTHGASGEWRSEVTMLLFINLWFPEASEPPLLMFWSQSGKDCGETSAILISLVSELTRGICDSMSSTDNIHVQIKGYRQLRLTASPNVLCRLSLISFALSGVWCFCWLCVFVSVRNLCKILSPVACQCPRSFAKLDEMSELSNQLCYCSV